MKTDAEIQKGVLEELLWATRSNDITIHVDVVYGHVNLTGQIDSYQKKMSAERTAIKVNGVKAVHNELRVVIPDSVKRPDYDIRRAVANSIKWNSTIKENQLSVIVKDGWVTLEGHVAWEYQRSKAKLLAEDITGVAGVTNLIEVVSNSTAGEFLLNFSSAIGRW